MYCMTNDIRMKIRMAVKNRLDISELIRDVEIKGEDLSYSIIKSFTRVKGDMSNCSFKNATIGERGKVTNISNNIMRNCNFSDVIFLGRVYMRRCDCSGSDFSGADAGCVEYQHTSFIGASFCECLLRMGVSYGMGAKFDTKFFQDLEKGWDVKILKRDDYENLINLTKIKNEK